jgi:hypothetical protein
MSHCLRIAYLTLLLLLGMDITGLALAQRPCSFTHANHDCTLTLDRNSFVFPPTLQMYPGAVVTVYILNGHDFEAYTLDQAPGQATVRPDVASSVLANLNTILGAATSFGAASLSPVPPALAAPRAAEAQGVKAEQIDPCKANPQGIDCLIGTVPEGLKTECEKTPQSLQCRIGIVVQALTKEQADQDTDTKNQAKAQTSALNATEDACGNPNDLNNNLSQFSSERCMLLALHIASTKILAAATSPSEKLYQELQFYLTPDAQPVHVAPANLGDLLFELCGKAPAPGPDHPCALDSDIDNSRIHQLAEASAFAASVLTKLTKPPSLVNVSSSATYPPPTQPVLNAMQLVAEEQAALDAIRKDLEGYASRIQDLVSLRLVGPPEIASGTIGMPGASQEVGKIKDTGADYRVTRSVNYSLNRFNLVTNSLEAANDGSKKALIVTINVVYGEARWEASSGVAVAFRPIRTFTVAPVISSGGLQTGSYISQTKGGPEIVPFASADFRLGDDFKFLGWRGAIYATGGIGYNISQESADFLVGPSISWRGVLLSALCDFGNGARLGQGLTVGESLPGTPASGTTPYAPTTITTLPTTNYMVPALTIGISVRIPGLAGR